MIITNPYPSTLRVVRDEHVTDVYDENELICSGTAGSERVLEMVRKQADAWAALRDDLEARK